MKFKKERTDKQRETERCGGCDCYETEDGCECKLVCCSRCGNRDNLYNMNHPEFHTDYWFNGMEYEVKLNEIICNDCFYRSNNDDEDY